MISSKQDLTDKIYDVKYDRIQQGVGLGVEEIDEFLRFKKGSFNLCVGHANTGKTTVILWLMLAYAMKHDLKWLIFSSENTDYSIARKLLEFRTNTPVQQLPDAIIKQEMEWINEHFKIMTVDKLFTAVELLKAAKEFKPTWNFDGMLIDPYNSLVKDGKLSNKVGGTHEYDYYIASEMRLFCKEENVTMWVNAHGVTSALRQTHEAGHKFANLPRPCGLADVEGGGKWGNRADDVISVHRYTGSSTDWMISDIHVLKVKETETGGRPTATAAPISLRMEQGNTAFTVAGQQVISQTKIIINEELPLGEPEINF